MSFQFTSRVDLKRLAAAGLLTVGLAACQSEPPGTSNNDGIGNAVSAGYGPGSPPEQVPAPPQPSIDPPAGRSDVSAPGADGTLAGMVVSAISAEPELNTQKIDVSAVDGTVYLRGAARDRESRRLATQVATSVDGVKRVQNELFVTAGS